MILIDAEKDERLPGSGKRGMVQRPTLQLLASKLQLVGWSVGKNSTPLLKPDPPLIMSPAVGKM